MVYYQTFSEYVKQNTKDAENIIKQIENPRDREIINETMQWLINQYKDTSDLLFRIEKCVVSKFGQSTANEIFNVVAQEQAKYKFKHSIGDWEYTCLFNEDIESKNEA